MVYCCAGRMIQYHPSPIEICPPCLQFSSDCAETSATACRYMCQDAHKVSRVGSIWLLSCEALSEMAFRSRFARRVFNLRWFELKLRPQPAGIWVGSVWLLSCEGSHSDRYLPAVSSVFVGLCWNFGHSLPVYVHSCSRSLPSWLGWVVKLRWVEWNGIPIEICT